MDGLEGEILDSSFPFGSVFKTRGWPQPALGAVQEQGHGQVHIPGGSHLIPG